ncbi:MAG: serine/threonine protein kinase [Planctomycetes bacterium]|nr:serine/threonine protein kinase [Planctomycetota bacterium]NOG53694.1 serine/threonine protein kinase [Planctomycetota bacterium]
MNHDDDKSESEPTPGTSGMLGLTEAKRAVRAIFDHDAIADDEAADPDDRPQIPGYEVISVLGRGATGVVMLGIHKGSDRLVAIKVFNHVIGRGPGLRRAWREIDVLARLTLPAVPRLLDHGLFSSRPYIVTEYIDGLTLADWSTQITPDLKTRVGLLITIAEAVQSLHEQGVIHRDIKPSNILIDEQVRARLIDLGVARLTADDPMSTLTHDGQPIGSPAFMAPEQARGDHRLVTTRSDVYSLGATAYWLLTGAPPFDMNTTIHEAIRRVAHDQPRQPREVEPTTPTPLNAILFKCVSPNPAKRYASADGFADDLRRYLRREPVEAGGSSAWQHVMAYLTHHPIVATAALCLLMLVGTVGSSYWVNHRLKHDVSHVEITSGGTTARLFPIKGDVLHTWTAPLSSRFTFATLADNPERFGGGKCVLIGGTPDPSNPAALELCVYHEENFEVPKWTSAGTLQLPDKLRYAVNGIPPADDRFRVETCMVVDVFPELDGDEIVATFFHTPYSPMAIRVYDFEGTVLYEVWHDGYLQAMHWIPRQQIIVLAGENSDGRWIDRGVDTAGKSCPNVLVGVSPQLGVVGKVLSWSGFEGDLEPAWYHTLLPAELSICVSIGQAAFSATTLHSAATTVRIDIPPSNMRGPGLYFDVHGDGTVSQPGTGLGWDERLDLPDRSLLGVGPLPPRLTERP